MPMTAYDNDWGATYRRFGCGLRLIRRSGLTDRHEVPESQRPTAVLACKHAPPWKTPVLRM
jgi:hypothetical protein